MSKESSERVAVKEGLATPEEAAKMSWAKTPEEVSRIRTLVIAGIGSAILTASSLYVALRMGALPWPSIFAAIVSMAVLKAFHTNLNEINVAHTGMTAGALLAGGLAFTVPALWMLGYSETPFLQIFIGASCAVIMACTLSLLIRDLMIVRLRLPYPVGIATFLTLKAGDVGGKKRNTLMISMLLAGIVVALRDLLGVIPATIIFEGLALYNIFVGIGIYPMAAGIGYVIGLLYMGTWFIGALLSYLVIIPISTNVLGYSLDTALGFTRSLGIGLIIGGGLSIIIKAVVDYFKRVKFSLTLSKQSVGGGKTFRYIAVTSIAVLVVLVLGGVLSVFSAIIAILGVIVTSVMAATVTGQTGIDPMEIFGILVLLFAMAVIGGIPLTEGVLLAMFVASAVGIVGDLFNDLKTGYLLETPVRKQVFSELIGGLVGAVVGVLTLMMFVSVYGLNAFGPDKFFVAPQAYAVSIMLKGIPNITAFTSGIILGIILGLLGIPAMTLGIGVYLPMIITVPAVLGGLVRVYVDKKYPKYSEYGIIAGSGLLGGEGVAGVIISLIYFILGR
jgi:putative OPT family oligopeptide transporter